MNGLKESNRSLDVNETNVPANGSLDADLLKFDSESIRNEFHKLYTEPDKCHAKFMLDFFSRARFFRVLNFFSRVRAFFARLIFCLDFFPDFFPDLFLDFFPDFFPDLFLDFFHDFFLDFFPDFFLDFFPDFFPDFFLDFFPDFFLDFFPDFFLDFFPDFLWKAASYYFGLSEHCALISL